MFGISAYSQTPYSSLAGGAGILFGNASVNVYATVTANGGKLFFGTGDISCLATVSATAIRILSGTGAIIGTATVTANGGLVISAAASVNGTATVTAQATRVLFFTGDVECDATVTADGIRIRLGVASIDGTATVTANGGVEYEGNASVEDEWGFSASYEPVAWRHPDIWLRLKLDALQFLSRTVAKIVDYKTGQKFGNEMSHGQQLQLYAISAFLMHPFLEYIKAQCWYLDKNEPPLTHEYTRNEALKFRNRWTTRGVALTTATKFPPKPSRNNCRFCDYAKSGDCEWRHMQ